MVQKLQLLLHKEASNVHIFSVKAKNPNLIHVYYWKMMINRNRADEIIISNALFFLLFSAFP